MIAPDGVFFEIDDSELLDIADKLGATKTQLKLAYNRALTRTAGTLRRMSASGLKDELKLRALSVLRQRLKTLRVKKTQNLGEVKLWFGANDLPIQSFAGAVRKNKKKGPSFRGQHYPDSFVARSRFTKRKSIFKRQGDNRFPLIEQKLPVADKIQTYLEDEIFPEIEDIFFKHFRTDLRGRVLYSVGGQRGRR